MTLAFDSGTVWRRWFAVMAIVPGDVPYMIGIKNAESFPDKRLTAENLEVYLAELASGLEKDDAWVVAFVADNASNMQKAIWPSMLAVKCGAHIIALLAKDLMSNEILSKALQVATTIFKVHRKELPSPCETRWNSLHRLILAILVKYDEEHAAERRPLEVEEVVDEVGETMRPRGMMPTGTRPMMPSRM